MRVKDIPFHDRPRERAWREGVHVLSDAELLAILLRSGRKGKSAVELAGELLHVCNGNRSDLLRVLNTPDQRPKELGKVQILLLKAALEFAQRVAITHVKPQTLDDALAFVFSRIRHAEIEHSFIICLDLRNYCIGLPLELNRGNRFGVEMNPRDVLSHVSRQNAVRFVVVHNHPSGDVSPSPQDVLLTKQIMEGAQWIGVAFHDHVIVTRNESMSFRANGWLD